MTAASSTTRRRRQRKPTTTQVRIASIISLGVAPAVFASWVAPDGEVFATWVNHLGRQRRRIDPSGIVYGAGKAFPDQDGWAMIDLYPPSAKEQ